jgi:hypothetical protein
MFRALICSSSWGTVYTTTGIFCAYDVDWLLAEKYTNFVIYNTSWWWANKCSKHVEAINRNKLKVNSAFCWPYYTELNYTYVINNLTLFFPHPCGGEIQMAALWSLYGCLFQDSLKYYRISGPSVQEICEYNVKVGKPDLLRTSVPWGDIYISSFLFKLLLRRFYSICLLFESPLFISIACKGKLKLLFILLDILFDTVQLISKSKWLRAYFA